MSEQPQTPNVSDLAAELAHQVNNPLAVVIASMSALQRLVHELAVPHANPAQLEELHEILSDVDKGLVRIRTVVRSLGELSFKLEPATERLLGDPFPASKK